VFLAFLFILSLSVNAFAADERASTYFNGYLIGMSAKGNGRMSVAFSIFGRDTMDQIGAYSIQIQEDVGSDDWIETFTVYGSSDTETFYSYNEMDHTGEYFFNAIPGVRYRAVMVAYAENSTGHEYSREIDCTPRVCK